ncbi:class E sortase [Streptomyces sp. NPDC051644]|uniref:class E sortase n=1 Tax=Streptomyces sp. NPDC051644 TaxID=3365666 RepID=UPI0037BC5A20
MTATAILLTHGSEAPSARASRGKAPSAPQPTDSTATTVPDPLTSSAATDANTPLGGDPKVPDKTTNAQSDAFNALTSWATTNPKGNGAHVVGGDNITGGGGTVTEVLRIPALGGNWMQPVYEGVSDRQLRAGVGHFPGTEKAGQIGNYAIAGHRSGVASPAFNNIERVRAGASITLTTSNRITYTYKVARVTTVAPTDVNVIAQVPGDPHATPTKAVLTLVTCWPADGHSKRVVVTADLIGSNGGTTSP